MLNPHCLFHEFITSKLFRKVFIQCSVFFSDIHAMSSANNEIRTLNKEE